MIQTNEETVRILGDFCMSNQHSASVHAYDVLQQLRNVNPPFLNTMTKVGKDGRGGLGVFACGGIPAGSLILVEHPVVTLLDTELASSMYDGTDGGDSLCILSKIAQNFDSVLEFSLNKLFPIREGISYELDASVSFDVSNELGTKLPSSMSVGSVHRAVQLNSLGYYTFPELCSYNDHLRFLSGTGIYQTASMFNHSCDPNVHHYSFGDVALFRTIRSVSAGEELFITYIGRDLLCETKSIRDEFLGDRDFVCKCSKCMIPELEDPWKEELDLQSRIAINMAPTNEARLFLLRSLLNSADYVTRDRIKLEFQICRLTGAKIAELWLDLIAAIPRNDFLSVVVQMHYMVHTGFDEELGRAIVEQTELYLGEKSALRLFEFTDFPPASEMHASFIDVYSKIR